MAQVAAYAPIAFFLGLAVGLGAASRWRIVRRGDYDRWMGRE